MLKIIGWLLGIASMGFVGMYFDKGEVLAGFICVIAIGFFIPPLLNKINNNARKKAEAKGKEHKDISSKSALVGGVVLLVIAAFLGADDTPKQTSTTENKQVTVKQSPAVKVPAKTAKAISHIDLVYNLQSNVENLIKLYTAPYSSFDRFSQLKSNIGKIVDPICDDYAELVKQTGNYNSPHRQEANDCKNTSLSMMIVLFDIRDGDVNSIEEQKQKLLIINNKLSAKLDEYRRNIKIK